MAARETAEAEVEQAQANAEREREAFERVDALARQGGGAVSQQEVDTQGQLQPTGALIDPDSIHGQGRVLDFEDKEAMAKFQLVPGTSGVVAVYTHHMQHLDVICKVLLRMNSWANYLFSDGH